VQQGMIVMVGEGKNTLLYPESVWKQTLMASLPWFGLSPAISHPYRHPKAEINNKIKLGNIFRIACKN